MKIYIAGRITGDPQYKEKFGRVEAYYRNQDYTVLNPACLPEGMTSADYMRVCFSMIDSADAVAFIPGWETSPGATLEREYCKYIKKPILDHHSDETSSRDTIECYPHCGLEMEEL